MTAVAFALHEGVWEKHLDSCGRRYLRDLRLAFS
jgi:hypothetical protein